MGGYSEETARSGREGGGGGDGIEKKLIQPGPRRRPRRSAPADKTMIEDEAKKKKKSARLRSAGVSGALGRSRRHSSESSICAKAAVVKHGHELWRATSLYIIIDRNMLHSLGPLQFGHNSSGSSSSGGRTLPAGASVAS